MCKVYGLAPMQSEDVFGKEFGGPNSKEEFMKKGGEEFDEVVRVPEDEKEEDGGDPGSLHVLEHQGGHSVCMLGRQGVKTGRWTSLMTWGSCTWC